MIAGRPDHGMGFSLSPGNASDFTEGKRLIGGFALPPSVTDLVMDRGYSGRAILEACAGRGIEPVVPPKSNMREPWPYNRNVYAYRNEIGRLFHRLKSFRRIATRYDKLDVAYGGFVWLGLIALLLRVLC